MAMEKARIREGVQIEYEMRQRSYLKEWSLGVSDVDRPARLNTDQFKEHYEDIEPFILAGGPLRWPAMTRWNPAVFGTLGTQGKFE